ncbi:MAG: GNAT family N-acetyltransferase [Planctomycetota bacterium]|jgi:ribosomal-protein-alanine N-acetyltransferase
MKVEFRNPRISDAKRYLEILSHPNFTYFPAKPKTLKEEQDFLRMMKKLQKEKSLYNFAVLANGKHVGGAGIKINQQFPYICEIGYFVDHKYWNKGIATKSVQLLEKFIIENIDIVRIEIAPAKDNIGSCKVAIKSGYKKEGTMKKYLKIGDVYHDCCLYAKVLR